MNGIHMKQPGAGGRQPAGFEEPVGPALLEHADYGEYLRKQENTLILLHTLRFIYASKEINITLLQPGAIPDLIKEIENDAGSIAAGLAVQLVRGDLAEAKKYLTTYLTNKITQMAQQKVGNN